MIHQRLKELKEKSNLTNQQIADLSGVPIATVNRILSGQTDNPSFITVSDMVKAMGGSLDELAKDSDGSEQEKAGKDKPREEKPHEHNNNYERLIEVYRETISHKNKWIKTLFWVCAALTAVIAFLLIFDIVNPGIGYIRY